MCILLERTPRWKFAEFDIVKQRILVITSLSKPKEKDEDAEKRDLEKSAYRAARKVRHLYLEIRADRLLTLTSRNKLKEFDDVTATWKKFMCILENAGEKFEYVAVPELHKNGEHFHIHATINGFVRADMLRRCWR